MKAKNIKLTRIIDEDALKKHNVFSNIRRALEDYIGRPITDKGLEELSRELFHIIDDFGYYSIQELRVRVNKDSINVVNYFPIFKDKEDEIRFYEDYKNYDNKNKSLLDSINDYIDNNKRKILDRVKGAFDL